MYEWQRQAPLPNPWSITGKERKTSKSPSQFNSDSSIAHRHVIFSTWYHSLGLTQTFGVMSDITKWSMYVELSRARASDLLRAIARHRSLKKSTRVLLTLVICTPYMYIYYLIDMCWSSQRYQSAQFNSDSSLLQQQHPRVIWRAGEICWRAIAIELRGTII